MNIGIGKNAGKYLTVGDNCIVIGEDAGMDLMSEDRIVAMNFAGIGERRAVMSQAEAEIVRAVVLRMFAQDLATHE